MVDTAPAVSVPVKDHWSPNERENVEVMANFVTMLMNTHDFDALRSLHGSDPYVQHSRGIPEGMMNLIDYVENLTRRFPEYAYDVKHAHADGEYVTFHSHATLRARHRGDERKGLNIIDTWRVVDGQVVEHWDAIQPLGIGMRLLTAVSGGRAKNVNSLF